MQMRRFMYVGLCRLELVSLSRAHLCNIIVRPGLLGLTVQITAIGLATGHLNTVPFGYLAIGYTDVGVMSGLMAIGDRKIL